MRSFRRSLVFQHTLRMVGLFILIETVVFAVLYFSTVAVYEQRENSAIHDESARLERELTGLPRDRMARIVDAHVTDEPGENDEYLLTGPDRRYVAGNIRSWPTGLQVKPGLQSLTLGHSRNQSFELHRVRALALSSGENLVVGRNLTELRKIRNLIFRALFRTILVTLVLGFGGGWAFSRRIAHRIEKINAGSRAILQSGPSNRMPVKGTGDEFDELAVNLNRMLDRIEQLMQGMRAVGDSLAHDMRKPVSRMRSRIELTLMGPRELEAYRDALVRTLEEIDDLLAMFNALLTIAMTESGAARDFESIDLARVVRSTVEIYEPVAEDAGLTLETRCGSSISLRGNPDLITQALANMLENAIKYAAHSGPVVVSAEVDAGQARLSVADRGPGIPAEFRDKAFDRFTRLEASRTTPGSGLGLSLVRAVAQLHEGQVELDDNDPGLRVTLTLPLR